MLKLAIITTHPIQYNAPLFRMLCKRGVLVIKVFYTWSQSENGLKFDPGFGENIKWDIPLLDGYDYHFSENVSKQPGSNHKKGIINPNINKELQTWGANALLIYGWNFIGHQSVINFFYKKIPILFRGDSTLLDEQYGFKKILRRLYLKYIYRKVDIAMYAGTANKAYFKAHGFKEDKLFFMPHAVENERFFKNELFIKKAKLFREEIGINNNVMVFLFAGKLDDNKNISMLLDVFDNIKTEAHLIVAGSGVLLNELLSTFKHNNRIHFLGFQNQEKMPVVYAASNVFILPSKSETWGLSINEAMAANNAIIISDKCGASFDLVKHNENGFVVKTNNLESLHNAIVECLGNNKKVIDFGNASFKKVKHYSFENDCTILENVILETCKSKR